MSGISILFHIIIFEPYSLITLSLYNAVESEEPFVISRKLLRRRHVRKEQLRKERKARGALNARGSRNDRARGGESERSSRRSSEKRGLSVVAPTSDTVASLPRLSPMLLKAESFSDTTRASPQGPQSSNANQVWNIEVDDSPQATNASMKGSITPDSSPVARIMLPRDIRSANMTRVSFSPLRSRNTNM